MFCDTFEISGCGIYRNTLVTLRAKNPLDLSEYLGNFEGENGFGHEALIPGCGITVFFDAFATQAAGSLCFAIHLRLQDVGSIGIPW